MKRARWLLLFLVCACPTAHRIELVESWPAETTLDHEDIPDAKDEWPRLIARARRSIDIAQFYVSDQSGKRLGPVLAGLQAAAARGVRIRLLADAKFAKTYPETLDRFSRIPNVEVRRFDVGALTGGVLHAKYFIVDGTELYLGSQNFDWRSLEHIQELGVSVSDRSLARDLLDVFETDWQLAGGSDRSARTHSTAPLSSELAYRSAPVRATFVASPKDFLPDESEWDLPKLVALIDSAHSSVRAQMLTYGIERKDERFYELDDALRRAVARGVEVKLLLSDWSHFAKSEAARRASGLSPLDIRIVSIPKSSEGDIPFARVVHAKYLTVDGQRAWVGTSNWERDYFYKSRNVGLILEGEAIARRLGSFFDDLWQSRYAKPIVLESANAPDAGR